MEAVIKQIAEIKEEYAGECKEYQTECTNTARIREEMANKEAEIGRMQKATIEDGRVLIMLKIDVGDAECRKRALGKQLEKALEAKHAAVEEWKSELSVEADLQREVDSLKGPDDYKKELIQKQESLSSLRQEIETERGNSKKLAQRLSALETARSSSIRLSEDIATLKKMKSSLLAEAVQLEQEEATYIRQHSISIPELQQQLIEAQRRYAYLCTYQQALR